MQARTLLWFLSEAAQSACHACPFAQAHDFFFFFFPHLKAVKAKVAM